MEPAPTLTVRPWPDPVIDRIGHDARSRYVEEFWLGVLGPSTTWFLRFVADQLDRHPGGFELDLGATARRLGLAPPGGRNAPLQRALDRAVRFRLARTAGRDGLDVRRRLPPLNRHQLERLPAEARQAHAEWQEQLLVRDSFAEAQRRARRLALSLFEAGEDPDRVERELHRWRHHPAVASAATAWALDRHRAAQLAATTEVPG